VQHVDDLAAAEAELVDRDGASGIVSTEGEERS